MEDLWEEAVAKMIDKLFKKAMDNSLCNTSYPLNKQSWLDYKCTNRDLFLNETDLCFYIHIPFCKNLCSFCEYTRFKKDIELEKTYIEILERDITNFIGTHIISKLYGFDIGGGTPTILDINNFKKLMEISKKINILPHIHDYEPSIEATFNTIDEEKISLIKEAGFTRISLGIQTINTKILLDNNRDIVNTNKMINIINLIKKYDMKVNIDLMYGIPNQKMEDIENSMKILEKLNPSQVTLYEMRYNMVKSNLMFSKDELYNYYKFFYENLTDLGYNATFGQNTFSKTNDLGLSSYLKYRMIDNVSYKGFGISAQSKSKIGLSYNIGKSGEDFVYCIQKGTFYEDDTYLLPKDELLAKYIAVCLYYGQFKLSIMESIIAENPLTKYKSEFDYLLSNDYILIVNDIVYLTELGFKYFGAVGSLFYSNKSKDVVLGDIK